MNDKLAKALGYIDEKYIAAAAKRKNRRYFWIAPVAAVLAVVLLFNAFGSPFALTAKAVSLASESRKMERPRNMNSENFDIWLDEEDARDKIVEMTMNPLVGFSSECSKNAISGADSENRIWSPVNAYIALAITAELTGGESRQQVLEALGVNDIETLRTDISALWEQVYQDNGKEISVLANSLWLDTEIDYNQDVMDILGYNYYTSVYSGDLGSSKTNKDIAKWLNKQTSGLLDKQSGKTELSPNSLMAIASTVCFQSKWSDKFKSTNNTEGVFHANNGNITCTFMNKELSEMNYYWAEDYGAVKIWLEEGSAMWFILPDEDKTVNDVLESGDYMEMITHSDAFPKENRKWMKVNLSVPKFDISSSIDLEPALKEMGLSKIFEPLGNDFSPSVKSEIPVFLDSINQNSRVIIDEDGVKAASYIILEFGAGSAEPPDEIIDFILDRPFIFAITTESIPLFIGTVNNPQ